MPKKIRVTLKNWKVRRISGNLFRAIYDATNNYFTLAGSSETLDCVMKTPNYRGIQLEKIIIVYDDATSKDLKVSVVPPDISFDDTVDLMDDEGSIVQNFIINVEQGELISGTIIRFTVNGTATKKFKPAIYFRLLGAGQSPELSDSGQVGNGNGEQEGGGGGRYRIEPE